MFQICVYLFLFQYGAYTTKRGIRFSPFPFSFLYCNVYACHTSTVEDFNNNAQNENVVGNMILLYAVTLTTTTIAIFLDKN